VEPPASEHRVRADTPDQADAGTWAEAGVAGEVDSRAYHLSADDQDRTTERHDRLIAHGIFPLHFSPKRIKTDPAGIISDLRSAIEVGRRRPPLPITALPAPG
jgi:hypothetical protein